MLVIPTISLVGVTTATIIAILISQTGLGHYLTDSDKTIKKVVIEKERRNDILDVTKQLSKDLKKQRKAYLGSVDEWLSLHQDYEATPEDFTSKLEVIKDQQQQIMKTTLDARDEMHMRMTPDEWQEIF